MLYVWDLKGARLEGRPFIRSMYGPWRRKDYIQRAGAMWAQKVGAPLPIAFYDPAASVAQRKEIENFVKAMRGEEPSAGWGMFRKSADGTKSVESSTRARRSRSSAGLRYSLDRRTARSLTQAARRPSNSE